MSQSGRTPPTRKERRATERATSKAPVTSAPQPAWKSPVALISLGALVVGIVIIALIALSNSKSGDTAIRDAPGVAPVELRDGRSLGRADAPVQIDIYEDPQCPVCGRFTRELEPLLVGSYIKNGTVRLTYHDFAFIGVPGESLDAAVGMRAADQLAQKFWDYQAIVFENQNGENKGGFSRDRLALMAARIGLDKAAFTALLDDKTLIDAVMAETAQGKALGIDSTPTLVVNGQLKPGLPTWDQLKALVDAAALAAAASPAPASPAPASAAPASAAPATPAPATPVASTAP